MLALGSRNLLAVAFTGIEVHEAPNLTYIARKPNLANEQHKIA